MWTVQLRPARPEDGPDADKCRVCGAAGPLTFEHVPPRSTFNRRRAEIGGIEDWFKREEQGLQTKRGVIQQRGSGFYTLCEECNNRAGRLYVPEFRRWARMMADGLFGPDGVAARFEHEERETYVHFRAEELLPARFMKQIVTMFLAQGTPEFSAAHPDLREFARDPERRGLHDSYQFYLAAFSGPMVRFVGAAATATGLFGDETTKVDHFVEIAYPPFAYSMSVGSEPGTLLLPAGNVTSFTTIGIDQRATVEVQMVNGYAHTPIPLDYRTQAAVERDVRLSEEEMKRHRAP
jgi:hypothetical protein